MPSFVLRGELLSLSFDHDAFAAVTSFRLYTHGVAATLDQARSDFEAAWRVFLTKRTEADFQAWRDQRGWTERKYAMWKTGERMPTQKPSSLITCPCGQVFDSHRLEETVVHVPHITASASVTVH
jgi:hypothetical protein